MTTTERLAADAAGITRAAALLVEGRLVAFPTETVYGLGARADRAASVRAIFAAKGRPSTNPLIVHVASVEAARRLAAAWPDEATKLARAFWPGPLTLVVARAPGAVCDEVTAGGSTVAVRVPDQPVARAILDACGLPIAAPSANPSSAVSPVTAAHVWNALHGRIDAVVDGGPTAHGIESTIVDVTAVPVVLRHGALSLADLARVVAVEDRAASTASTGEIARAPGAHARHYAPRAPLETVPRAALSARVVELARGGARVGAVVRGGVAGEAIPAELLARAHVLVVLPDDAVGFARGLYAALHDLDDAGCDRIVVLAPPTSPGWEAVRDRLRRARAAR